MKKDPYVLIEHIRESIAAIEDYTHGISLTVEIGGIDEKY
jgi:hypothetical protein